MILTVITLAHVYGERIGSLSCVKDKMMMMLILGVVVTAPARSLLRRLLLDSSRFLVDSSRLLMVEFRVTVRVTFTVTVTPFRSYS
jgi:hypothetical protein